MIIDTTALTPNENYHLMTQTVIPRPIAWVLTKNHDGESHNLAPFSYFSVVASEPPIIMLSFAPKDKNQSKDSFVNILRQRQFVVHIASEKQCQAVQDSAARLAYGASEVDKIKLILTNFEGTQLQRLDTAPIAFACRLHQYQSIGQSAKQQLVFAEVTHVYVDDESVTTDGKKIIVDAKSISPLARLGRGQFAHLGNIFLSKSQNDGT